MPGTWALGWVTGDVVTAAEFRKGTGAIYDTTLGASAASIDVTGIVATYAHLRVVVYARGDTAAASVTTLLRFNNDASAIYDWQTTQANNATLTATASIGATSVQLGQCAAGTATANIFDAGEIVIPHYAGTTNQKSATALSGFKGAATLGAFGSQTTVGWWRSVAAINRVTVFPSAGNFVAGTRLTIYAMGA